MQPGGYPRRFGPVVLLRPLGEGGMGVVDLAVRGDAVSLHDLCVVKRLLPETACLPRAQERFEREARVALRVRHVGLARGYQVGEVAGEPYLIGEYVHGWTLENVLAAAASQRKWLSVPTVLHLVAEVAGALAHLHDQGVVHRDLCPANIIISFGGEVKLIDYGVAKSEDDEPLTAVGVTVGRDEYAAPEAWRGEFVDPRADLYSLGVVLWRLLARRRATAVFSRRRCERLDGTGSCCRTPPPPSATNREVSAAADALALRAIACRPEDRFSTALHMMDSARALVPSGWDGGADLRALLRGFTDVSRQHAFLEEDLAAYQRLLSGGDSPDEPVFGRRRLLVLAGLVGVSAAGWLWWGLRRPPTDGHERRHGWAEEAAHRLQIGDVSGAAQLFERRWRRDPENEVSLAAWRRLVAAGAAAP